MHLRGMMLGFQLLLFLAGPVPLPAADLESASAPRTVTKSNLAYESALADYRANRVRDAARALKAILIKDSKNKEAAMLLATMYYQNHKLKRALYWFDRGDASLLNHDNAFAWGSTYLEFNDDKKAALGFRYIIKNKGPFRPFAAYYLGVIAYQSSQWLKARKYLQRVNPEDLTVALRVNRRRYLSDIKRQQEKMLEAIIGGIDKQAQDLGSTQPTEPNEGSSTKDNAAEDELEAPQPNAQQVERTEDRKGWRSSFKGSLALTQHSQLFDNHGLSYDAVSLFAHREGFGGQVNYGDERNGGNGFFGGLEFSIGDIGYSARLDQTQFFAIDQTSGIFASQIGRSLSENSGFLVVHPHLNWYLNDRFRFEMSVGVRSYFPEYDALQLWGQTSEQLGMYYEDEDLELGLEFGILQPFDAKQNKDAFDFVGRTELEKQLGDIRISLQAYGWQTDHAKFISLDRFRLVLADSQLRYRNGFVSEAGGSGSLLFNLFSETSLQLRFDILQREAPSSVPINRLTSSESIESVAYGASKSLASINVPLWESVSLTGSTAYHLLTDYHYSDVDPVLSTVQEFVTDVEQSIFQAGGLISFADWIRLSGSYAVTENNFLSKSAADKVFRRRNPDYLTDSIIYLELNKSF